MLEPDPAAYRPRAELLVDALARHPDHLADLLLGDRDGAPLRLVLVAQAQQRAGQTAGQVLQDNLLDLIAGPAQSFAKQLDELHRKRRLAAHERNELAPVNDEQLAIGVGGGIGRPRQAVEQRDLPEYLAGLDQVQNRVATIRRRDADLDRARDHRNQAGAGIALGKDRRPTLQRDVLGVAAELIECLGLEIGKIGMLAQHRQLVVRKQRRAGSSFYGRRSGHRFPD